MLLSAATWPLGTIPITSLATVGDAGPRPTRPGKMTRRPPRAGIRGRVVDLAARLAEEPAQLVGAAVHVADDV
jgi:hypothetical protein